MAEKMLDASVRGAREEAAEVLEHPMRPPAEQVAPLQESVAAAQTSARETLESGPRAREMAAPTRNEQRKAEDRELIRSVGERYGITFGETEEDINNRLEQIRSVAWRAADRAAHSEETLNDAREAGKDAVGWGDVQTVRDAMSRVIGDAASEAAYQVLREELRAEGLSGEALEDSAKEMASRAGTREIRDAWRRTAVTAGGFVESQRRAAAAGGEEAAAAPVAAAPQEEAVPEEEAEEAGLHARALVFEFSPGQDFDSITNKLSSNVDFLINYQDPEILKKMQELQQNIGRADEQGKAALEQVLESMNPHIYEGLMFLDSYLDRYGFREGGHIEIRIDLEKVRAAGHKIDEERVGQDLSANPEAVLTYFIGLGIADAVEIVQTGGAAGGLRPPETRLEAREFLQFMGLLKRAEQACSIITQEEARQAAGQPAPAMFAYGISGISQT